MKQKLIEMIINKKLAKMHQGYCGGNICRPNA